MLMIARGDSMLPTLQDGHAYEYQFVNASAIGIGDIILFCADDCIICHRVMDIFYMRNGKRYFKTKGDNCPFPDSFAVTAEMVSGKIDQKCFRTF